MDSNLGPLVSETTALPSLPQLLPLYYGCKIDNRMNRSSALRCQRWLLRLDKESLLPFFKISIHHRFAKYDRSKKLLACM